MKKRITSCLLVLLCILLVSCTDNIPSPQESTEKSDISADISTPEENDVSDDNSETESDDGYSADTVLVLPTENPMPNTDKYSAVRTKITTVFSKNNVRDDMRLIVAPAMVGWEPSPVFDPVGNARSDDYGTDLQIGNTIKNDEKFIYLLSLGELIIFSAENGKAEQVSVTHLPDQLLGIEILLYKNQVIIICANEDPYRDYKVTELSEDNRGAVTSVFIVEVSERGKTKQTDYFVQSGSFAASRIINGQLVLITSRYTTIAKKFYDDNLISEEELLSELPVAGRHLNALIPAENIEIPDDTGLSTLTITSKTDLNGGEMQAYCKMINDYSFYITEDSIYVFDQAVYWYGANGEAYTEIERYDISGELPIYIGKTRVYGRTYHLAVSEYNGYLRIPTNEDYGAGLIILDKDLNIVSELYGIGGNQQDPYPHDVETYKNTVIYGRDKNWWMVDVSEPEAPKVISIGEGGEIYYNKAFLSEDTLLTSIFCRDDTQDYGGIKLETYDISDEKNILKTGEILLENNSRELAYMLSPGTYQPSNSAAAENEFAVVPYTIEYWDDTTYVCRYMLALISTDNGLTLVSKQEIDHETASGIKASKWQVMYIDDAVYFVNLGVGTKETDITSVSIYFFTADDLTPIGQYSNN